HDPALFVMPTVHRHRRSLPAGESGFGWHRIIRLQAGSCGLILCPLAADDFKTISSPTDS
ncbi:MAG: hypothetical protein U9P11_05260, partial [Pseudomonadota bacterium]|nr:hypothetical protein [Pseudomonadota bacterium]